MQVMHLQWFILITVLCKKRVKQKEYFFEFYKKKTGCIQQQQFDFSIWPARRNEN